MKGGRKKRRNGGRKVRRNGGRKEGRKEGMEEGRYEGMEGGRHEGTDTLKSFYDSFLLCTSVSTDKETKKCADCDHKYICFLTYACFRFIGHLQEDYFRDSLMTLKGLCSLNALKLSCVKCYTYFFFLLILKLFLLK